MSATQQEDIKKVKELWSKANCYKCIHRDEVAGSAHSHCTAFKKRGFNDFEVLCAWQNIQIEITNKETKEKATMPLIDASNHGIRSGWFNYPLDFDPVWLKHCGLYEQRKEDTD